MHKFEYYFRILLSIVHCAATENFPFNIKIKEKYVYIGVVIIKYFE